MTATFIVPLTFLHVSEIMTLKQSVEFTAAPLQQRDEQQ